MLSVHPPRVRSAQTPTGAGARVGSLRRGTAIGPGGLLLGVLVGAWVGHLAEYLRVWGQSRLVATLTRTPHVYFGPVGLVLVALAVVGVHASLRLATRLDRRMRQLRASLLGGRAPIEEAEDSSWVLRFPTLVGVCWVLQVGLYLAQENLEARAFGLHAPGLGAVAGVHAWAPLVHFGVATVVASVVWLTRRSVTELLAESRWAEACLARRRLWRSPVADVRDPARWWTPGQRWGMSLWARPPPLAAP